jgi:hypothetical protein
LPTKEQKLQMPCPKAKLCQEAFTCGFKHEVHEYQAALARSMAEAEVDKTKAVQNLIKLHALAEVSPALATILPNLPPGPMWNYPPAKGFSNKAPTEDSVWVD